MASIVVFVDGSMRPVPDNISDQRISLSWGVAAIEAESYVELSGSKLVKVNYMQLFEIIAFLEGLRLALRRGYAYSEMSFYSDCPRVSYAQHFLHEDNYRPHARDALLTTIAMACRLMEYEEGFKEKVIACINRSRFIKVLGHKTCVYNNRVDYLAKCAGNKALKISDQCDDFDLWLSKGFVTWPTQYKAEMYYPPFVEPYGSSQLESKRHNEEMYLEPG